jgi:biopolymer transport protein ExbD
VRRESRCRLQPDVAIPIVSMADIAFLLLIFFMLSSTFIRETGVDVKLPKTMAADSLPKRDISIEVSKSGEVTLAGHPVVMDDLQAALREQFEQTSNRQVTIRGDQDSPYGTVIQVMAIVRAEGAEILCAAEQE